MSEKEIKELIVLIACFKVTANQQLLVEPSKLQKKVKQIFNGFLNEGNRLYKQLSKELNFDEATMYELIDDIEDFLAEKRKSIIVEDKDLQKC